MFAQLWPNSYTCANPCRQASSCACSGQQGGFVGRRAEVLRLIFLQGMSFAEPDPDILRGLWARLNGPCLCTLRRAGQSPGDISVRA